MKELITLLKSMLAGHWEGLGFAKFPTIDDTAYTEKTEFVPDQYKDAIFYNQKTWYKNDTPNNGHTVFWDCGFILLKEDKILLHSAQIGGRIEAYELTAHSHNSYTFETVSISGDPKAIRSQRILTLTRDRLHYEHNMATHSAGFQNHLVADLKRQNAP